MPRLSRKFSYSKVYHIIVKGIDSQNIFYDNQDRKVFLKYLLETKKQFEYQIYAYCLMVNHVHLIIRVNDEFLSKSIQGLLVKYVSYFNKKYDRSGTLFQDRFKSKLVENQRYFLEVCKYVHRNPEKARICKTEKYEWSSYLEYIKKEKIINKRVLLHYFNNDINEFIKFTTKNNDLSQLDNFAEFEMIERLTDEQLENILMQKFAIKDIKKIINYFTDSSRKELEELIARIKKIKGTNITQVSRVIRKSRKLVEKIWNKL